MNNSQPNTSGQATPAADRPAGPIKDRSTLALVCGVMGLFPMLGLIPATIGIIAGRRTCKAFDRAWAQGYTPVNAKTGHPVTRGAATAGVVLGIVSFVLYVLLVAAFGIAVKTGLYEEAALAVI